MVFPEENHENSIVERRAKDCKTFRTTAVFLGICAGREKQIRYKPVQPSGPRSPARHEHEPQGRRDLRRAREREAPLARHEPIQLGGSDARRLAERVVCEAVAADRVTERLPAPMQWLR